MKVKSLIDAIDQFRKGIDKDDYANLGAKGKYLTVPYRIKFVREYFEDSRELSNEEMKQMSSEWTERRRNSLIEKEKRKEEEAEAQKEMWKRVQEMMANDDD